MGDGASGSLKSPKSVLCLCVLGFEKEKRAREMFLEQLELSDTQICTDLRLA